MPRVAPRELAKASRLHPLLGKLMGVCRSLRSSKRELRWLEEEILRLDSKDSFRLLQKYRMPLPMETLESTPSLQHHKRWEKLLLQKFVEDREKGTPLQYVVVMIENQPFGHLNLHVRNGVFIPRWETEEWSIALAQRLRKHMQEKFTLVDLCTGSGAIPLLLKSFVSAELEQGLDAKYGPRNPYATFVGIEKSRIAAQVANMNLRRNNLFPKKFSDGTIYFLNQDIERLPPVSFQGRVDIITCNPPYIPLSIRPSLSRTVTKYEPSEALFVNSPYGDEYYYLLYSIATRWGTKAIVMEVGDLPQAERVKSYFSDRGWDSSTWLDSAEKGRVVVAIKSEKWSFLLSQPNYSHPVDLSPFPRRGRPMRGIPGSIISTFTRPKLITPEIPPRLRRDKEKVNEGEGEGKMGFVDRLLEKLRINVTKESQEQSSGLIKYLEDLKKISK